MSHLRNKLQTDYYRTPLPYGDRGSTERDHYLADQARLDKEFRADLIEEHQTGVLPDEVESALYAKAYEDGHSAGRHEVAIHYDNLAELVLLAFLSGTKNALKHKV